MPLRDAPLGAALPADILPFLAPRGVSAVDAARLRIERPRDGWTLDALGLEAGRHVEGAVALVEASDAVSLSLDRRARQRGTGVSVSVSLAADGGIDVDAALAWAIDDAATRAVVVLLDRIEAPERCLDCAVRASTRGRRLVAVRSHAAAMVAEVRPGITRAATIEAAFVAAGIPVVATLDAGLALAEWLAAGGDLADDAARPAVSFADPREAARFAARHADHPSRIAVVDAVAAVAGAIALPRAEDAVALADALDRLAGVSHAAAVAHDDEGELDIVLSRHASGALDAVAASDLASAAGLPTLPFVTVHTGTEAIAAGLDVGFPIAAKAVVRRADGTTAVAAVTLGVPRLKELRKTVAGFQKRFGDAFVCALLQPQVAPVAEVLLGAFHEPGWGAFVWLRPTGVLGAVAAETTVVRAPVSRAAAAALVERSALRAVLVAEDGRATGDVEALHAAIETVGALAARLGGRLRDFVLHPLAVLAPGAGAFALDVRAELGPAPRRETIETPVRLPRRTDRRRTAF